MHSDYSENGSLFEIDKELEAAFEAASEEQERTGTLSEQTGQHCTDLLGELGKKVDRIAGHVRVMELNAPAAEEEATRLASDVRARFEDRILPVNDAVAERWGLLTAKAKTRKNHKLPVVDGLLAAAAQHHNLILVTRNVDDVAPTGVQLFNPWD